ncbi:ImpA family type VI secretion system protein [Caballeronia sp. BR00000012568055]|uniref:type VI secretion system protein TssA n=1 Tax=Caballeronia sp. BR00000012568055 TaxID=2918761 RepID=UPI0023FA13D4|nr:type VI secretion system ImpA family N-terminal domain-containing protein [Caballeronia sp. BR00000012568055]
MKVSELIDVIPPAHVQAWIEPLLAPVAPVADDADDAPGGPNLEDTHAFMALLTDAEGRPEQRISPEDAIPAVTPNWVDVKARAEALLEQTKDLRIGMIWLRAVTALDGLAGCEAGLHLMRELCLRYWDSLHPARDPDPAAPDGFDLSFRCNVLSELAAPAFMRTLRDMPAVRRRGETPSLREIERAQLGKLTPPALALHHKHLDQAVAETTPGLDVPLRLPGLARALEAAFDERFGMQSSPRLEPLAVLFEMLAKDIGDALARAADKAVAVASKALGASADRPANAPADAPADTPAAAAPVSAAPRPTGMPSTPGTLSTPSALTSRADAIAWLEAVSVFLERAEPAHPAPLLIRRAIALLTMDFIGVIRELAPESLKQIYAVAGICPPGQTKSS